MRFRQLTYLSEKLIKEIEDDDDEEEIDASDALVDSVANEIDWGDQFMLLKLPVLFTKVTS